MRGLKVALAVCGLGVLGVVWIRGSGISAVRTRPGPLEERGAVAAWRFLVPADARLAVNPVAVTTDMLKDARAHWADHCATCHDNDGSGDTAIGGRVYPRAPDMRGPRTQSLTDPEPMPVTHPGAAPDPSSKSCV